MAYAIQCLGWASGDCPHAGKYVSKFDHDAHGGRGYAEFTPDLRKALRFHDQGAAFEYWRRQSRVRPKRPDGKPNRPMTAMHATFVLIAESGAVK